MPEVTAVQNFGPPVADPDLVLGPDLVIPFDL